jgi:hypothetical protein
MSYTGGDTLMKLLLTSNFPMPNNEQIAQTVHDYGKNLNILYIGYSNSAKKYCAKLDTYSLGRVDFVNIAKDSLSPGVADYNVILLHGGNPFMIKRMLTMAFSPGFFSSAKQLIVSVSGSTCVLSREFTLIKTIYPSWEGDDTSGLNLFPYEILPHYNRYCKRIQEIARYSQHKTVYAIPDGAAVSYDGSAIELIGDVKIFEVVL